MATDRRPYHRTADSVGDEHWTNDEYACIGRFSAHLHSRWRTERIMDPGDACTAVLGVADLMRVTGKLTPSSARALAERCAKLVSWSVQAQGKLTSITWPKWAEFQGLVPETGGNSGRKRSPSASRVPRPASSVPKKEEELPSGDAGASPLLNLLAKLEGDRAEKIAFLADTGPQIEVDAASGLGTVPSLTVRYYRRYLAGDRRWRDAAAKADRAQRIERKLSEYREQGLI